MKLSRPDPYRRRRHPIAFLGWLLLLIPVLLLCLAYWKGGEQPVTDIELPVTSEQLAG